MEESGIDLPVSHLETGSVGDIQLFSQLHLRVAALLSAFGDKTSDFHLIHSLASFHL